MLSKSNFYVRKGLRITASVYLMPSYISRVQIKVFQYGIFFKRCISFLKKILNFLFLAAPGLCCCAWDFSDFEELRLLSSCAAWTSHFCGICCCRTQILGYMGLAVVAQGLRCP